jgi:hypothetical protein
LIDTIGWSEKRYIEGKKFAKQAFIAERLVVAQAHRDGNKKLSKISKGVVIFRIFEYL